MAGEQHPNGYPFALFVNHIPDSPFFIVADSFRTARNKAKDPTKPISKVLSHQLIGTVGHKEAHKFLRTFDDTWIISNGHIFFRKVNDAKDSSKV